MAMPEDQRAMDLTGVPEEEPTCFVNLELYFMSEFCQLWGLRVARIRGEGKTAKDSRKQSDGVFWIENLD